MPLVEDLLARDDVRVDDLDFVLAHTGGRRILDLLGRGLRVDPCKAKLHGALAGRWRGVRGDSYMAVD